MVSGLFAGTVQGLLISGYNFDTRF